MQLPNAQTTSSWPAVRLPGRLLPHDDSSASLQAAMGKGGDDANDGAPSSALPRGVMLHNYGTAAADTVSSRGAVASAGKRNFSVREGETVELLDLEDETWWQVGILGAADAGAGGAPAAEGASPPATRKGWVPEEHVRVLAHRVREDGRMVAGSKEWRARLPDEIRSDADREVAKLLAYQQILEWRAANGKPRTQLFLCEDIFDHPLMHGGMALMLATHGAWAWSLSPSVWQVALGVVLGFIAVDLLSTVYHLCLDYGILATPDTTVTDLHHKLTLNYNLFTPRKLVATSYVAVVPLHAAHLVIHALLAACGVASPTYTVYTLSAAVLGCSCGFVHNAAHRRRHGLEIASAVWLLQDLGVLLHPDVHAGHHQGKHDQSFSLFSGVTHPLTDRLLAWAWDAAVIPRTPETDRAKLD